MLVNIESGDKGYIVIIYLKFKYYDFDHYITTTFIIHKRNNSWSCIFWALYTPLKDINKLLFEIKKKKKTMYTHLSMYINIQ